MEINAGDTSIPYRVNPSAFPWFVSRSPDIEEFTLPELQTDIVLTDAVSRIVVDTKFFAEPFDERYGKTIVRSGHLNQIFAYMQNLAARDDDRRVDGVILYAAVSGDFQQDWTIFGHNLKVAGVDLSKDWLQIEGYLLSLIGI